MKVLPYSYSSLTSYENCPFKHFKIKIEKSVKDQVYAQAQEGIDIHSGAELLIKENKPYVGKFAPRINEVVTKARTHENIQLFAEHKISVDRDQKPTGWFDKETHARGIIDVLGIMGERAHIVDWKTGKPSPFSTQLKHNAMLVLMTFPELKKVSWSYEWLKHGSQTTGTLHREFVQPEWDAFEQRVVRMEKALENGNWPKKPSGLCKAYCAVTECEHNGNHNGKQAKVE